METQITLGKWYHKNGLYHIVVTGTSMCDGIEYVHYFSIQSCDNTYAEYRDADHGEGVIFKIWYESNTMRVASKDRFLSKFVSTEVPLKRPVITQYDINGNEIVVAPLTIVV